MVAMVTIDETQSHGEEHAKAPVTIKMQLVRISILVAIQTTNRVLWSPQDPYLKHSIKTSTDIIFFSDVNQVVIAQISLTASPSEQNQDYDSSNILKLISLHFHHSTIYTRCDKMDQKINGRPEHHSLKLTSAPCQRQQPKTCGAYFMRTISFKDAFF